MTLVLNEPVPEAIHRLVSDLRHRQHAIEGTVLLRVGDESCYRLLLRPNACQALTGDGPADVTVHIAREADLAPLLRGWMPIGAEPPRGPLAVQGDTTLLHDLVRERMLGANSDLVSLDLPDPLTCLDGTPVRDADTWRTKRRPEVLELFRTQLYGRAPGAPDALRWELLEEDDDALGGLARQRQVRLMVSHGRRDLPLELLVYLPRRSSGPVPMFLGLNFCGNHTVQPDPAIRITQQWIRDRTGGEQHQASESQRGSVASRWPVARILARGYGLATLYCGDLDPDYHDGFRNGVHPLFYRPGQSRPEPDQWGTIGAWAWGLSRVMDYFQTDSAYDAEHVAVMGHSRLGKTALWAGAQDERFALVISNCSGCCGASLERRRFGETLESLNRVFPHWCCANARDWHERSAERPFDQHMLLSLIAPRPLYVASASEDSWADPRGEFLSALAASAVYERLGVAGLPVEAMPEPGAAVMGGIGYHARPGGHDVTVYDWEQYMAFADRHWG